jgi:DNA-binding MarR family transcriptional regulator
MNMRIEQKIFSALERIHTASRAALQRAVVGHCMSPLQAQILRFVEARGAASVSLLADQLRVSKPTVSDAVSVLLEKGLAEKIANKDDARASSIFLTERGKQESAAIDSYAGPFLDSVGQLTPEQKDALWGALLHLIQTMEAQGLISHQRMCATCRHFARDVEGASYYCTLMNSPLAAPELRIDCAEHERLSA